MAGAILSSRMVGTLPALATGVRGVFPKGLVYGSCFPRDAQFYEGYVAGSSFTLHSSIKEIAKCQERNGT